MKEKIVFFDVDGTIYHNTTGVVRDAVYGIKKLRENGHKAFLCTGRSRAGLDYDIVNVGFDGIVASCGTYIEIGGKVIKNDVLKDDVVKNLVDNLCYKKGIYVIMEGSENMYIGKEAVPKEEREKFSRFIDKNKGKIKTFEDEIKNVNKFCMRLDKYVDYKEVLPIIEKDFDVIVHTKYTFELVPHGYTKGTGIEEVANYYGIDIKNTIAFGDGSNDIPMLEKAGYAVVMGNGNKLAMEKADYITTSVLENGIGNALKEIGII